MYEASIPGLIRTILIIMLIYYGVKILFRLFFPLFVKYILKKAESNFQQQFNKNQQQQTQSSAPFNQNQPKPNASKKVGEYIDFEEIE